MFKKVHYLLFFLFFIASIPVLAQNVDSLKRVQDQRRADSIRRVFDNLKRIQEQRRADSLRRADSIKIDTNVLNRYRIEPRRNAVPVRIRPFQIVPELIPTTMLDYKVSYWRKWIVFGINLSQSGFSNNWSGGGNNSIAVLGNFDYKTEYNKAPFDYTTELILMYGKSRNTGQSARKTNDRIFLDNKVASQLSKNWYFFGSVDFESQFDLGYQYANNPTNQPLLISKFMSPGYLTESVGFEYKPSKVFDLRIGTGTARQTFVLDTTLYHNIPTNYGVAPGHTFLNQLAFQLVSTFDKNIMPNVHLNARYALFVPYGGQAKNSYITHRLDVTLAAQVNRLVNVTINGSGIYDKNASNRIQGFEGLALGILYKFP